MVTAARAKIVSAVERALALTAKSIEACEASDVDPSKRAAAAQLIDEARRAADEARAHMRSGSISRTDLNQLSAASTALEQATNELLGVTHRTDFVAVVRAEGASVPPQSKTARCSTVLQLARLLVEQATLTGAAATTSQSVPIFARREEDVGVVFKRWEKMRDASYTSPEAQLAHASRGLKQKVRARIEAAELRAERKAAAPSKEAVIAALTAGPAETDSHTAQLFTALRTLGHPQAIRHAAEFLYETAPDRPVFLDNLGFMLQEYTDDVRPGTLPDWKAAVRELKARLSDNG